MASNGNGLRPEDVFTPRASAVNLKTYISRPDLERALELALRLPKHVVIHGESGAGKTWLYKKILGDLDYYHEVANMGLCSASGSVSDVLKNTICRELTSSVDNARTADGGVPGLAKLSAAQTEKNQHFHDAFYAAISAVRLRAREKPACLIFDNLEQVTQRPELINELAGFLLLLDDERYANKHVRTMLVGTSAEIRAFISQVKVSGPVANRITEIPEVSRLTDLQAEKFVAHGLFDLLGCEVGYLAEDDLEKSMRQISALIGFHSDRIPLHIQDLCFYVACGAESNNWLITESLILEAIKTWIKTSLVADISRVQHNLNSSVTKIGRRNQVLFCLGKIIQYDFSATDVESAVKKHFPESSKSVALNIPKILADLATSEHPLIRKNPNSSQYRFIDPKYRIIVRWILKKNDEGMITLRDFDNAIGLWAQN